MINPIETEQVHLSILCDGTPDVSWVVQTANLAEKLNEPFQLLVNLATEDLDAEPVQMLGKPATLTITRGTSMRQVMGIVSEIEEGSTHPEMLTTNIAVEPAFESLRHRINTKIFQDMTVPDILKEVLNEGLALYKRTLELRLERTYPNCEYRTQYNESDFSFCERLMEEEGIAYWFEFDGEEELLVLADSPKKYGTIESTHDPLCMYTLDEGGVEGHEYISAFHVMSQVRPTKIATRHFDWTHPGMAIEGNSSEAVEDDRPNGASFGPEREVYEHDHRPLTIHQYSGQAFGDNDVTDQDLLRREEQAWESRVINGRSTVTGMRPGANFEMIGHPQAGFDAEYLVLYADHSFSDGGQSYINSFQCIPKDVVYRPTRVTRRPRISSIQTATVVGPAGEEIHTDEYGRIKVQFHWDRLGVLDEHSSLWVRVMQPWAGAGWGFVFIPRIGMEVIVNFIDGDPDRPLAIGSVYNGDHPPPYPLPEEKTKSTIKTESSLGGGGFNELRFEDKAGSEEVFTHAQKDYNEVVENDHNTLVHHDQTNTVDNNQTEIVHKNQSLTVNGNRDKTVDGNEMTVVKSNRSETVMQNENLMVAGAKAEEVGLIYKTLTGIDYSVDAGNSITIHTGKSSITLNKNGKIQIKGMEIELIGKSLIKLRYTRIEENC